MSQAKHVQIRTQNHTSSEYRYLLSQLCTNSPTRHFQTKTTMVFSSLLPYIYMYTWHTQRQLLRHMCTYNIDITHTHAHTNTYTHAQTCTHTYTHMHTHVCTHAHTTHTCTHTCTHTDAHTPHTHTCTHTCTHMHTHAHTHMHNTSRKL